MRCAEAVGEGVGQTQSESGNWHSEQTRILVVLDWNWRKKF